jgi:hypothetical protein
MMATPAQVANDLAAQAAWWGGRDEDLARTCRDTCRLIRALDAGEHVQGRSYQGVHARLAQMVHRYSIGPQHDSQIARSLRRACATLQAQWGGVQA